MSGYRNLPLRTRLDQRLADLKKLRSSWDPQWQDVSDHLLPWAGRFFVEDANRGGNRHNEIYDGTGTLALRVLGAGLMAGATSPARPWIRLNTQDLDLNSNYGARLWLDEVVRRMMRVFARSNVYRVLHSAYEELAAFGTTAAFLLPDYDTLIHLYPMTVGEFSLAQNMKGQVQTCVREFQRTVAEVVEQFPGRVSNRTKQLYEEGSYEQPVRLAHIVQPRQLRDARYADARNMAFESVYWEVGVTDGDPSMVLRESGFTDFPVLAPRWATVGGDVYGNGVGFDALGDVKQLQHEQLRKAEGIDYTITPPIAVPTSLKSRAVNRLPGGVTYMDAAAPTAKVQTMWEVKMDLSALREDIMDVRDRIRQHFFADLFLMLTNASDTTQRTAAEIAERHEEKLLMLGPVLERLHNELLTPLVQLTFQRMLEVGALPPPPPELAGAPLAIEFVSILAQAQRAIGVNAIDRFVANMSVISERRPEILDRLNVDNWVDEYSDMMGVPPKLIVPVEEAQALREARAKAKAAADQAALMQAQAKTTRDLAASPMDGSNALTASDALGMFSGVGSVPTALPGGPL